MHNLFWRVLEFHNTKGMIFTCLFQGLYPESHGIVDNSMYDEKINETFMLYGGNAEVRSNPAWWGGEPVSERQNLLYITKHTVY